MSIKKVWIEEGCISCSLSEAICPEVFEVEGSASVKEGINFSNYEDEIIEAAGSCPVGVIKYEKY